LGICIALTGSWAKAAVVEYQFSGTLDQPFNGATIFSGEFYFDPNTPLDLLSNRSGSGSFGTALYQTITQDHQGGITADPHMGVSVTVGGDSLSDAHYANPGSTEHFLQVDRLASYSDFSVGWGHFAAPGDRDLFVAVGFTSLNKSLIDSVLPPFQFNPDDWPAGDLILQAGNNPQIRGTITNIRLTEPTEVAEPASLSVFAVLCLGVASRKPSRAAVTHYWRRLRDRDRTLPS
jgi:hypothetical protein